MIKKISQVTHFQPFFMDRCKKATPWIVGFALPILLYLIARHQKVTTRTLVALGFGTTTVACCAYGLKGVDTPNYSSGSNSHD